ncbi:amidase [Salisediminibacterium selenitireducens]|uniref:Amidase n=1 Tax=Bacillus selenitireducens (strain ATCC 700615 / DSM 15326 / MLS10) TaxID=439292 RepID=D6XUL8_BACIE|nr:amidase family protein [Salisediminibacterium selenitireducens]ADH99504.1 Amidase [[Bacillus] selenitireducens MLS10]
MKSSEYAHMDAVELVTHLRENEVTVNEVVDKAYARINGLHAALNAVVSLRQPHQIREDAEQNGPFAGVPFLLKDMGQALKGERLTSGSYALRNNRSITSAEYTNRILRAGFIPMGHTNVPEFSLLAVTEPMMYGPTKNPWDLTVTPGGSSGGSAAAVASGMVPVAGANDGGGSIRIPASYCGLVGLKPTRGRTPVGPGTGRNWQGASQEGVLTKTVRDTALVLDQISGPEETQAFRAPEFNGRYHDVIRTPLKRALRIAVCTDSPIGGQVDTTIRESVWNAAKWLEKEGHHAEEVSLPVDGHAVAKSYMTMYFGETAATITKIGRERGQAVQRQEVEPVTWLLHLIGQTVTAEEFVTRLRFWDEAAIEMANFHQSYDLFMTPVTAMGPAKIGELAISKKEEKLIEWVSRLRAQKLLTRFDLIDEMIHDSLERTPFTQLANLTGQPAISLPIARSEGGLPAGIQFTAPRGREDLLLQTAAMFEQSEHWQDIYENPFMRLQV